MAATDNLLELRVDIPGKPNGRYGVSGVELHLVTVNYPEQFLPADLCSVPHTLTESGENLGALLLGTISHPADCIVTARLLGVVELRADGQSACYLVAVAAADAHFAGTIDIAGLSPHRRADLERFFRLHYGADSIGEWKAPAVAHDLLHRARQHFRLARAEMRENLSLEPAWKPISPTGLVNTNETETHTAAEYAYHALPARFRQYVAADLAGNERILFALHRPAMRSALRTHHVFSRGKRLEEAVFLIGDRQLSEVAELMPPDRAGIRYGFVARGSAPERLEGVRLVPLDRDVVGLEVTFHASGGQEAILWEFPAGQGDQLDEAVALLRAWLPAPDDRRLRRATPPAPPEEYPALVDPGANDPTDTLRLADRLLPAMDNCLRPGEAVLARCLLPAWIKAQGAASLIAVTDRRLLVIPDPAQPEAGRLRLELPLHAVTSFEFSSTLLRAYLKVFFPDGARVNDHVIHFGPTLAGMDELFRVFRQALATTRPSATVPVASTRPVGNTSITQQFANY